MDSEGLTRERSKRREAADCRQENKEGALEYWRSLTPIQQIQSLDRQGYKAKRQRTKITEKMPG